MNEVKTLSIELLASTNSFLGIAFPSLEILKFDDMQSWERWLTAGDDNEEPGKFFPRLQEISIESCPKLTEVSIDLIPSLRVLHIAGCSEELLRSMVGVSSSIVRLTMLDIKGLTQLHEEVLNHLGEVEDLHITSCDELRYLWESESKACKFLVSLKKLGVDRCEMLVSLGEKEGDLGISMASLKEVELYDCKRLEHYKCPNSIEGLVVWNCGLMTSLTFPTMQALPSTIKLIHVDGCENLEKSWLLNKFLSSLESLVFWRCDNMMSFPEGCFAYLTKLEIWNCDSIESVPEKGFGFLPLFCLKTLWIRRCKNLKSFPHQHLPSLTSLEELKINNCPSLDYSFPCGLWPPNLRNLRRGCLNNPMSEWGLQNFPSSLVELRLYGQNSGVVSFAEAEDVRNTTSSSSFLLPPSLTSLYIDSFEDLESVSKGLQHLACLENLQLGHAQSLEIYQRNYFLHFHF